MHYSEETNLIQFRGNKTPWSTISEPWGLLRDTASASSGACVQLCRWEDASWSAQVGTTTPRVGQGRFKLWISAKRQELCFCETLYVWYKCWEIEARVHLKVVTDVLYSWQSGFVICKSSFPIFFYTWVVIVAMYEQECEKGERCGMELFSSFPELTVWSQGAVLCSMTGVFWAGVFVCHNEIAEWQAEITW